jgi:hypothetical protein
MATKESAVDHFNAFGATGTAKLVADYQASQQSTADQAMLNGGINLDAALYNMQVLRDGNGMVLPISQQPIGQFMKIKGFKPVLLNIEHNINLPARLGVKQASTIAG